MGRAQIRLLAVHLVFESVCRLWLDRPFRRPPVCRQIVYRVRAAGRRPCVGHINIVFLLLAQRATICAPPSGGQGTCRRRRNLRRCVEGKRCWTADTITWAERPLRGSFGPKTRKIHASAGAAQWELSQPRFSPLITMLKIIHNCGLCPERKGTINLHLFGDSYESKLPWSYIFRANMLFD